MIWTTRPRSEGAGALSYFEEGSGPPLVLIHGVGLRAEAWCGVLPELTSRYRVICIDMPGHGLSPLDGADSLEDFVARCGAFIAALDIPIFLAGHSMGALLAVELASRMPKSVLAFAGLNTVFGRSSKAAEAVQARAHALSVDTKVDTAATLCRWFGEAPVGTEKEAADACDDWLSNGDTQGYAAAYRIFATHDGPSEAAIAAVNSAAFFLTGAKDPNSTPAMSQALAEKCNGHWMAMENAAHMMPMTHPQRVARHLSTHFGSAGPRNKTNND